MGGVCEFVLTCETKCSAGTPPDTFYIKPFGLDPISPEDEARWQAFGRNEGLYNFDDAFLTWSDPRVTTPQIRERLAVLLTCPMGGFMKYPHGSTTDSVGRLEYCFKYKVGGEETPANLAELINAQPALAKELALAMLAWRNTNVRWNDYDRTAYNNIFDIIRPILAITDPELAEMLQPIAIVGDIKKDEKDRKIPNRISTGPIDTIVNKYNSSNSYDEVAELVDDLFKSIDDIQESENPDNNLRRTLLHRVAGAVIKLAKKPLPNSELFEHLLDGLATRVDDSELMRCLWGDYTNVTNVAMLTSDEKMRVRLLTRRFTPNLDPASDVRINHAKINDSADSSAIEWLKEYFAGLDTQEAKVGAEQCKALLAEYSVRMNEEQEAQRRYNFACMTARLALRGNAEPNYSI